MFDGLCFALRSGNAEVGQKLKAQPFLQHPGGRVERITPALDEIEVLIVKKLGNDGADGFGGIPFALFVAHLDGDYFNVMGLPLCRLGQLLNELGVELL